jgi:hypothetical protein
MANEITLSVSLNLTRTVQLVNWVTGSLSLNQTGTRFIQQTMNVPTTATAIPVGLIGTLGYMMIKNIDTYTTNTVNLLSTTGGITVASLVANDVILIKLGSSMQTPALIAASTAAPVEITILEL